MSRKPLATIAGLTFITAYIVGVIVAPDRIGRMHWAIEALYWGIAGVVWVFPIRWLMLWSVHKR